MSENTLKIDVEINKTAAIVAGTVAATTLVGATVAGLGARWILASDSNEPMFPRLNKIARKFKK